MQQASVPTGSERRRSPRFPLPLGRVSGSLARATLLNISRQGMAVEVPVTDSFARGETHSFTLQDLSHSVEVRGRVRWVRSDWRDHRGANRVEYVQVAGFTFEEILTEIPAGIWRNLRTAPTERGEHESVIDPEPVPEMVERQDSEDSKVEDALSRGLTPEVEPEAPAPEAVSIDPQTQRPGPPILLAPLDGATLDNPAVMARCKVTVPEEITSVAINGVVADLEGDLVEAEIELDPGTNLLRVLIWREDGSYRTYFLGRVTRKEFP